MKNLKLYYIVSIAVLAVMMLIFFRTLKVTGWFERERERRSAEQVINWLSGDFDVHSPNSVSTERVRILSISPMDVVERGWLTVRLDTTASYRLMINDFEDEQVLVEIFEIDSMGRDQRMDGCELLLAVDSSGLWTGSTLGEFCGYSEEKETYFALSLQMDTEIRFMIETKNYDDQTLLSETEYLLKRQDHDE